MELCDGVPIAKFIGPPVFGLQKSKSKTSNRKQIYLEHEQVGLNVINISYNVLKDKITNKITCMVVEG